MSNRAFRGGAERRRTALRGRLILLVALPVLLLGGSYFLFIEYLFAQAGPELQEYRAVLRVGGIVLVGLALILALACGFLLVGRMTRPIRLLSHLAETGELPSGSGAFLHHRDWEVFYLYKRVQALVLQNRSGAKALEELEHLRRSLASLRSGLEKTGQHGVPAPIDGESFGVVGEISEILQANRRRLVEFFEDLRGRTEALRTEVEELRPLLGTDRRSESSRLHPAPPHAHPEVERPGGNGGAATAGLNGIESNEAEGEDPEGTGAGPAVGPTPSFLEWNLGPEVDRPAVDEAMERIRRLGSVLALEMERIGPDSAGLGLRYERFVQALESLESAMSAVDGPEYLIDVSPMEVGLEPVDDEEKARAHHPATVRWEHLEESLGILERRLDEVADR